MNDGFGSETDRQTTAAVQARPEGPGLTGQRLANALVASGGRDATGDTGFLTLNPVSVIPQAPRGSMA